MTTQWEKNATNPEKAFSIVLEEANLPAFTEKRAKLRAPIYKYYDLAKDLPLNFPFDLA